MKGVFMKQSKKIIAMLIVLLNIGFLCAEETKYVVTSNADSGKGTLRDGIKSGASEIFFDSSMTIKLNSTLEIKKDVVIRGTNINGEVLDITLAGGLDSKKKFSILGVSFADANITVEHITFTKGYAGFGGAINFSQLTFPKKHAEFLRVISFNEVEDGKGGNLIVTNCTFTENFSTIDAHFNGGGAIYVHSGSLTINDSSFTSNEAENEGGAVWVGWGNNITITGSAFTENNVKLRAGGAVMISRANNTIIADSSFDKNTAGSGGAVRINEIRKNFTIRDSAFTENVARGGSGGALEGNQFTIINCIFTSNSAGEGGAINGNPDITNCAFTSNSASGRGGVIWAGAGNIPIANSTFDSNSAGFEGGVIWTAGNVTIINSTFVSNSAVKRDGGAIFVYSEEPRIRRIGPTQKDDFFSFLNILNSTFYQNTAGRNGGTIFMGSREETKESANVTVNLLNSILFGDIFFESGNDNVFNSAFNILGGKISGTYKKNINLKNNVSATPKKVFVTGKLENNVLKISPSGPAAGTGVWVGHRRFMSRDGSSWRNYSEVVNYSIPGSDTWEAFIGDTTENLAIIAEDQSGNPITIPSRGATAPTAP